jgi:hypothetical protein
MSQRMSAAEWVKQEDARRRGGIMPNRSIPPSQPMAPIQLEEQRLASIELEQKIKSREAAAIARGIRAPVVNLMDQPIQSRRPSSQPMQPRPVINLMDLPTTGPSMAPMQPTRPVVNLMDQPTQSRRPSAMAPSEEQIAWPGLEQNIARGIAENIRVQQEGRLKNAFREPLYEKPVRLSAMPQETFTEPSIEERAAEWRAKEARREHERKEWEKRKAADKPQFLGEFEHRGQQIGQFAVRKPDGQMGVALAVRGSEELGKPYDFVAARAAARDRYDAERMAAFQRQ